MPMSKATVALRGATKSGPMDRYSATENATPYQTLTRLASCWMSREREYAIASTPISGSPTPVTRKPSMAGTMLEPACCPMVGG